MSTQYSSLRTLLLGVVTWPLAGLLGVLVAEHGLFLAPGTNAHRQLYVALQWMLLAPVVVQLVLHFPLFAKWKRNAAIHVAAAVLLCLFRITADPYPRWVFSSALPEPAVRAASISRDLLVYLSIAMAVHLLLLVRGRMKEERAAASLRREVARAERETVMQALAPELIARSFDEIARRVRSGRAETLIERFGDFLRTAIPDDRRPTQRKDDDALVALQRELDLA